MSSSTAQAVTLSEEVRDRTRAAPLPCFRGNQANRRVPAPRGGGHGRRASTIEPPRGAIDSPRGAIDSPRGAIESSPAPIAPPPDASAPSPDALRAPRDGPGAWRNDSEWLAGARRRVDGVRRARAGARGGRSGTERRPVLSDARPRPCEIACASGPGTSTGLLSARTPAARTSMAARPSRPGARSPPPDRFLQRPGPPSGPRMSVPRPLAA
jgi:hypothetical protein